MNIPLLAFKVAESHGRLWAIQPERAQAMAEMFAISPEAFSKAFPPSERTPEVPPEGVALISLSGVMSRAGMPCTESASTIDLSRSIRSAMRDEAVSAIVLDVDSPGGTVAGTADLADLVSEASKSKPIYAYVGDMACSAAYWVASQATAIWASPNATAIGNIGVRAASVDDSAALESVGVKVRHYVSGPYKAMGAEGQAIPQAHHDEFQRLVDSQASNFFGAVGTGRKLEGDALAAVTDGRWFTAAEAKANGLIDRTGSLADLFQAISTRQANARHLSPAARPAASAPSPNKPMSKLKDILAHFRGNPEAAKAAGLADDASLDALEAEANASAPATPTLDAASQKLINEAVANAKAANDSAQAQALAVASTLADVAAREFADSLILPDAKGYAAFHNNSRAAIESGFRAVAMADGGGILKIDAQGKLITGPTVEAYKGSFKDAPRAIFGGDTIRDADPAATGGNDRATLLGMTAAGRAILAKEKN